MSNMQFVTYNLRDAHQILHIASTPYQTKTRPEVVLHTR